MKNYRIILTTTDNPLYLNFWSSVVEHWKLYGFEIIFGFITDRNENDELVKKIKSSVSELRLFKPLKDIPDGNQGKVTRMFLASEYEETYNILMDIDMYIFDIDYCKNQWWSKVSDTNFLAIGGDVYNNGKFPMYNTCAKGNIFKEVINPLNLKYEDLLKTWYNVQVFDDKESLTKPLANRNYSVSCFSDESLLRVLLDRWENKKNILYLNRIIDKKLNRIENDNYHISQLENNYFFDSFPGRPLNVDKLKDMFDYLGISEDKRLKN